MTMDPRKHYAQFPKMFDDGARTDRTSAALSHTTRPEDVIQ